MNKLSILTLLLFAFSTITFAQEESIIEEVVFDESEIESKKRHQKLYDNGQLKEICSKNEKGQLSGEWKSYYENSNLKSIGIYKANRKVGEWKKYHLNRTLFEKANYNDEGYVIGKIVRYHNNGVKAREGFGEGRGSYKWIEDYDINGELISDKNTSCKWKTYNNDGTLYRSGEYKNKKKHGKWVWYFGNNQISFFVEKNNGLHQSSR